MRQLPLLAAAAAATAGGTPPPPKGTVDAVYQLIDRVLPGQREHFQLSFATDCPCGLAAPCFSVSATGGKVSVVATGANELAAGLGFYLREHCNMTIGWPRGGGSHLVIPQQWPDATVAKRRNVPWSYMMNVCTHSYSLQWYSWADWERFIDWMALSGINNVLGMTGQEEIQYKVFQHFGLNDTEIRYWFNGPGFLTWSRGQNEYGANIAGPLPRSFMKDQWALQRQMLDRYRSLGVVAQLPAFQGNVPVALRDRIADANITKAGATGWMNSVDPMYAKIADVWMQTLIADFGTDHWYQLDGYFNGATAPWLLGSAAGAAALPACEWSAEQKGKYVPGCDQGCKAFLSLGEAQAACIADPGCGGLTQTARGYELRSGSAAQPSPSGENAWLISNAVACRGVPSADADWRKRGAAAYTGLNRTDPDAMWSFQGWAFVGWQSVAQEAALRGFVDSVPEGRFVVIDMSVNGDGEWKKWNKASFFGAHFIWTTLHDFGGTDAIKGNITRINEIPFAAMKPEADTGVFGTGFTPEGIDQNPVYYEFMIEQNWRAARVPDVTAHVVARAHRRYGLSQPSAAVTSAWTLLANSAYTQDLSVQDGTGVPHLPGGSSWSFEKDMHTPTPTMCQVFKSWEQFIAAAAEVDATHEPFRYDLVNTGREVLAQLATPASQNFSKAAFSSSIDAAVVNRTGLRYIEILNDLDTLVGTDSAFLLGPWLAMARKLGENASDCVADAAPVVQGCPAFYDWNARCQLTTWNPTKQGDAAVPKGPVDYASKHWSGLIRDYYAARAAGVLKLALSAAAAGKGTDGAAVNKFEAELAYDFQVSTNLKYPVTPTGDAIAISRAMYAKYKDAFSTC
eukprot:TRINITY_DN7162_c0_g1_i1.p1 TRINITY_DN7162_c0_g1~~TRINITY_DN7162_c0_g1_i1.p1  ORF type:complete len:853 (+),score=247.35 TRINITY_DN7162_c0_g1_i1:791-3349(+)